MPLNPLSSAASAQRLCRTLTRPTPPPTSPLPRLVSSKSSFYTSTNPQRDPATRPGYSSHHDQDLGRHFYLNKALEQWASKPAIKMTLRQLVFFGKTLGKDPEKILKSANYVRQELPVRIAHRIRDLQALPFVVMTNKHLEDVYNKYWSAFETLRRFPHVRTMDDNERFCALLKRLLEDHLTIIPSLTIGIVESSHHLPPNQLDKFMERMLRSRISRRVLAEQHIALSDALDDPFHFFNEPAEDEDGTEVGDHVGIIYTRLSAASVVNKGIRLLTKMFSNVEGLPNDRIPKVSVDGDLDARFAYIPEHLEYIVFELLKNAIRATMRKHAKSKDPGEVRVTIVEGPPEEDLIIRISDNGGGLPDLVSQLSNGPYSHVFSRQLAPQMGALPNTITSASTTSAGAVSIPSNDAGSHHIGGIMPNPANSHSVPTSSDPLIDALCSFSNVRRRLELEEEMEEQLQIDPKFSGKLEASSSDRGKSGSRSDLDDLADSASQVAGGTRNMLNTLLEVGKFKGTVNEQMVSAASSSHPSSSGPVSNASMESLENSALSTGTGGEHGDALPPPSSPSELSPRAYEGTGPAALNTVHMETGLGLPMAKVYCDFFGGNLSIRSLDGHSTDIYVRLPKLGTKMETIEDIVL
ncbi:hypothetical protein IE53DRAFT_390537 [Violaceomyces palustris]|uniref:Uncharacterized protein n=1 Tax=Violaceomyces palustris TaxID=1673888 RepID=A0ACD0NND6_9BASI|nr:hypothetical protein IE53DRAFT_390537 [Violaceomyces palustris]